MLLESIDEARIEGFTEALSTDSTVRISTSRSLAFNDLAFALEQSENLPQVQVLTDDDTVSELRDHFISSTKLSEYVEDGLLEIRSQTTHLPTQVLVNGRALAVTGFPEKRHISLFTSSDTYVEETEQVFSSWFEEADSVNLRQPPYSTLRSELEERFDEAVRADFEAALREARYSDRPSLSLHPATLSLLVGAYHELEFYRVGSWGENTRLASKATFSRMKKRLEESEVIDVEPVSTDVGRPRHQLQLGSDYEDMSVEELVDSVDQQMG